MHSSSGEYFLTGSDNGYVRVHPLSTPRSLSDLSTYWSLSMHDNHYGAVTHLVTSFDDQFVLSGGADGNVFVYQANLPTAAERAAAASIKVLTLFSTPKWFPYLIIREETDHLYSLKWPLQCLGQEDISLGSFWGVKKTMFFKEGFVT